MGPIIKPRRRPDCSDRASGRTTVRSNFWKFGWNSFLIWAVSGWWCPVVQTVALPLQVISIPRFPTSEPRGWSSGRLDFVCDTFLMDERVRTVAVIFPSPCFGRKCHSWSNTECRPDALLKRPDGCKLEQFEASRHRGMSRRMMLWIVGHLMVCHVV
jgi:hypothetical protein